MDQDRPEPSPAASELRPSAGDYGSAFLGAGEDAGILGIDNVRLDLPVAGVASRLLAVTLDQILILVAVMLWVVLCMAVGMALSGGMTLIWVAAAVGAFSIDFLYYTFCEIRMGGRTPGKSAVGLRTVNALGGQASPAAIAVRNAMRVFDYLVGVLMVMIDQRRRRLGDLVAATLVVHDPPAEDENPVSRWPTVFTAREIALTELLLRRLPRLTPERARELAELFLAALRGRDPAFVAAAPGPPEADPVFELWRLFGVGPAAGAGEPGRG